MPASTASAPDPRVRAMITPEGLSLPLVLASRGARAGALLFDLMLIFVFLLVLGIALLWMGIGVLDGGTETAGPAVELLIIAFILLLFGLRFGYFLAFELGPRGATPGKRLVGIRVAARPAAGASAGSAGRLTAEAVIARNLMRDVEVFIPATFLLSGGGGFGGVVAGAAGVWLAVFVLLPCFNRDFLRAGDMVAGTWVVEAQRHKLLPALSLASEAAGATETPRYRFGEAELSVYGEHELQVLERVLRTGDADAQREVMEAICRKIGWQAGEGDERAFLDAFYAALRDRLERGLRFGRRKRDKHTPSG